MFVLSTLCMHRVQYMCLISYDIYMKHHTIKTTNSGLPKPWQALLFFMSANCPWWPLLPVLFTSCICSLLCPCSTLALVGAHLENSLRVFSSLQCFELNVDQQCLTKPQTELNLWLETWTLLLNCTVLKRGLQKPKSWILQHCY